MLLLREDVSELVDEDDEEDEEEDDDEDDDKDEEDETSIEDMYEAAVAAAVDDAETAGASPVLCNVDSVSLSLVSDTTASAVDVAVAASVASADVIVMLPVDDERSLSLLLVSIRGLFASTASGVLISFASLANSACCCCCFVATSSSVERRFLLLAVKMLAVLAVVLTMLSMSVSRHTVGGSGLGMGFSTGLVRPSLISCSEGMRSTSLPLFMYASDIL